MNKNLENLDFSREINMKLKMQMLATIVAVTLPVMASAQEDGKEKGPGRRPNMQRPGSGPEAGKLPGGFPGGPMGMMQMLPLMKVLDTDQDGSLSATEIANASKTLIQLDKNGDGVISTEEMRPDPSAMMGGLAGAGPGGNGPMNGQMMTKLFESRDKNSDGKLTGDEIPERIQDKLKIVDKDGDGSISKGEFASVAGRMEEAMGKRPGKDGNSSGGVKPKRPIE
jgi:Ca2+-binding EF-hand superfamily protein